MNLKPVMFVTTSYRQHYQNIADQSFIQKAFQMTQDPEKLKQMIGVKAVADVFQTLDNLDKMAIRKDYHQALVESGIDFKFIVKGIKQECLEADKPQDRLKGYQILLKSMGMDSYDDKKVEGGSGWEDALQKVLKDKEPMKKLKAPKKDDEEYKVSEPKMPDSIRKRKQLEKEEGKSLYE